MMALLVLVALQPSTRQPSTRQPSSRQPFVCYVISRSPFSRFIEHFDIIVTDYSRNLEFYFGFRDWTNVCRGFLQLLQESCRLVS
jgi:hypothetical protein